MRDVAALIELLVNDDLSKNAERAIARVGAPAIAVLRGAFDNARPPLRGRIVRAIGRLAAHADARTALVGALEDTDAKTRRNAVIALGHARDAGRGVEEALLAAWSREDRVEMRRSLAASLGKVGTARSLPRLAEGKAAGDAELSRIADRAIMMIERTESRGSRGSLDAHGVPERPLDVVAFSRKGVEGLLVDELSGSGGIRGVANVIAVGPGTVTLRLSSAMGELFRARTMLSFRFPLPTERLRSGESLEDAVARAATGDAARAIFGTWTLGGVRYRIAWEGGSHKRAATWAIAGAIAKRSPELMNDPTSSLWELAVTGTPPLIDVALVPRALSDPRFVWRRRDVPAASHPTVAAALARVAAVRPDDVVWDPFVGSGAELIERSLLGPYRSLVGSDTDPQALEAARENLDAAGVEAHLERADALTHSPQGVTLIVTNPPMGRRASRTAGLADSLDRFVFHAATVLAPGGRLVWMAPWPERARTAGSRAGLTLDWAGLVDMGGFDAEMQRWRHS